MSSWKKIALAALILCFSTCSGARLPNTFLENTGPVSIDIPLTNPTLQFFTFGDWGSGDSNQRSVAEALRNFCGREICDFGLLLGDNFYESGVESVDDPLWQTRFEQMYQGLNLPFYAVLGNHDHGGNIQAQIDYSTVPEQNRWKMPARQYTLSFSEPGSSPLIEIFAIDSETVSKMDTDQLREDVNASQAQWKILAMHHPIYGNGSHGDTDYLIDFVLPIICDKVDLVLVGHDHIFSHLVDPTDGCGNHHLVVGTGGRQVHDIRSDSRALFSLNEFGFASLGVTASEITIRFHRTDGGTPYEFHLQK